MSAQKTQSRSMTTLFFLFGALAFTLSSLPGGGRGAMGSSSQSSVSGCELEDQLNSGNSAGCSVKAGKVSGRVDVNLETVETSVRSAKDFAKFEKGPTQQVWRVKVRNLGVEGLETDCSECDEALAKSAEAHIDVQDLKDLKAVVAAANDLFEKQAKELSAAATTAAALAKKKENCQVGDDGEKLTGTKEILDCRVNRLGAIDDKEKAADYYDKYIQSDLQQMAISEDKGDRRIAADLMKRGSELSLNGNPYIKRSLMELNQFGAYSAQARALQQMLLNPLANPAQQKAARTALAQLQGTWGQYFQKEGYAVQNMNPPGFTDYDFGGSLYADNTEYNAALNSRFASIADTHNLAINGTNVDGSQAPGQFRTLHGTPSTSLGGQTSFNGQPTPSNGQPTPFNQQPQQQLPLNGAPVGLNAHRLGMPVR